VRNACYGCKERHPCCWSDCEKYAEYRDRVAAARKEEQKYKNADGLFADSVAMVKKRCGIK